MKPAIKTPRIKQYKIKDTPGVELLAITLYNEHGEYAASWFEVSEDTRNRYRKIARGESPLATKRVSDDVPDHDFDC